MGCSSASASRGERPGPPVPLLERRFQGAPLQPLEHEPGQALREHLGAEHPRVQRPRDVLVGEAGRRPCLGQEVLDHLRTELVALRPVGLQDLQRHRHVELQVASRVDDAEAPLRDHPIDPVLLVDEP